MAEVHASMDKFNEQLFELENAIRINPNSSEANWQLGWRHATFGRFAEAFEYLRRARVLDPLDPAVTVTLLIVLRTAGKIDEALEVLSEVKELHPRDPVIYGQTAACYIRRKDFASALDAIDIGQKLDPNYHWLKIDRGSAYAMSGRREEALDELRDLMKDESESKRIDAQVWIRTAIGDIDEAFVALMRQAEIHS
jgi:tetratricopeptide (TPR) repeat protein